VYESSIWLPRPLDEVFAFFSDASNLEVITPPWLSFSVVTPAPIEMRPGTLIDYRLRFRGFPLRWRSEITSWDPPHRFADAQVKGPYRQWIHEHTFVEKDGGTLAGDRVEAMYGMENGAGAYFSSHRNAAGRPTRFGLTIRGSKGLLETYTGSVPDVHLLEDSAWSPGRTGSKWMSVSTAGVGKPEPLEKGRAHQGNIWTCEDLFRAIEDDRDPISSVYEARGATEMIVAAFEAHRQGGPVKLPLENRENPLLSL